MGIPIEPAIARQELGQRIREADLVIDALIGTGIKANFENRCQA